MNHDDIPMWDDPNESSALRHMLRAGRGAPSDYDVERGLARHLANVQASAGSPAWATGLGAARGASTPLLTWLVVPLVAASAFVGVWLVARQAPPPEPLVRPDAHAGETLPHAVGGDVVAAEVLQQPANGLQPAAAVDGANHVASADRGRTIAGVRPNAHAVPSHRLRNVEGARAATRGSESSQNADGPAFATGESDSHAARPTGDVTAPSRAASQRDSEADSIPQPRETTAAHSDPPAASAKQPEPAAPSGVDHGDTRLEREMQMLAVAQRVLGSDPSRALRLAHQGDREFPGSMFSAERKQVGLLALVQLGRLDEARRLGQPFLVAYPNAPWSERLRRALATGRIPAP
jgi:hypothetical protein